MISVFITCSLCISEAAAGEIWVWTNLLEEKLKSFKSGFSSSFEIPLIYSWAITIHKAQGTTLDSAQIDIGNNIFECGQTYVALSRIKSLEGLYLIAFNPQKIKIYKKVEEFYNKIRD